MTTTVHTLPTGDRYVTRSTLRWVLLRQDTPSAPLYAVRRSHHSGALRRLYHPATDYLLDTETGRVEWHSPSGHPVRTFTREAEERMFAIAAPAPMGPEPVMAGAVLRALAVAATGPHDPHPEVEVYSPSAWDLPAEPEPVHAVQHGPEEWPCGGCRDLRAEADDERQAIHAEAGDPDDYDAEGEL